MFSEPYRSELKAIIRRIGYDYDIEIVELEVPVDNIHMVVMSEPKLSPPKIMQVKKRLSTRVFQVATRDKRKYFWGAKLWAQSYFLESIGNANEDVIRAYVQNQLETMNEKEAAAHQFGLFCNSVACDRVVCVNRLLAKYHYKTR